MGDGIFGPKGTKLYKAVTISLIKDNQQLSYYFGFDIHYKYCISLLRTEMGKRIMSVASGF